MSPSTDRKRKAEPHLPAIAKLSSPAARANQKTTVIRPIESGKPKHQVQCLNVRKQHYEHQGEVLEKFLNREECDTPMMQHLALKYHEQIMRDIDSKFALEAGTLFVCGSDESNQLGTCYIAGDYRTHKNWKELPIYNTNIVGIAAGGLHSAAVDDCGRVWTWGSSDGGNLGRKKSEEDGDDDHFQMYPQKITGLVPSALSVEVPISFEDQAAVQVVCGDTFTMILTRYGSVYFVGSFKDESNYFRPMPPADRPDDDWGNENRPAPCGVRFAPRQLVLPEPAVKIFAGPTMAAVLLQGGSLLTFGIDAMGELGRGITKADRESRFVQVGDERPKPNPAVIREKFMTPKSVAWPEGYHDILVLDVAIGQSHMMVVGNKPGDLESHVFCTGANNYGQLGMGNPEIEGFDRKNVLTLVPFFENRLISRVACGAFHSVFVSVFLDRCYSCGRLDKGQLGNVERVSEKWHQGEKDYRVEPKTIQLHHDPDHRVNVVTLVAANDRTMVVTHDPGKPEEKTYFAWGFNEDIGALGIGLSCDVWEPEYYRLKPDEASVMAVALGDQHAVLLLKKKEVEGELKPLI